MLSVSRACLRTDDLNAVCGRSCVGCATLSSAQSKHGPAARTLDNVDAPRLQFHPELEPAKLKATIFKDVWDTPVCDMFTSKDDADFAGECVAEVIGKDKACSDNTFCTNLADSKKSIVESVIVTQMAKVLLGFTSGASGLMPQHDAIGQARALTSARLPQHAMFGCISQIWIHLLVRA
jgi:hypothetical protein